MIILALYYHKVWPVLPTKYSSYKKMALFLSFLLCWYYWCREESHGDNITMDTIEVQSGLCVTALSPVGVAVAHSLGGALVGAAGEEAVELAGIPEGGRQQS